MKGNYCLQQIFSIKSLENLFRKFSKQKFSHAVAKLVTAEEMEQCVVGGRHLTSAQTANPFEKKLKVRLEAY